MAFPRDPSIFGHPALLRVCYIEKRSDSTQPYPAMGRKLLILYDYIWTFENATRKFRFYNVQTFLLYILQNKSGKHVVGQLRFNCHPCGSVPVRFYILKTYCQIPGFFHAVNTEIGNSGTVHHEVVVPSQGDLV